MNTTVGLPQKQALETFYKKGAFKYFKIYRFAT